MKKTLFLLACAAALFVAIAVQNAPANGASSHAQQTYYVSLNVHQTSDGHSVQGSPTISAAFIHLVLAAAHSPAAGDSQTLYDLGVHYGIDPAYALAFFKHESSYGTTGEARVTLSLGNERCIQERPCIDQARGGYALMRSWADGFDRWYSLILNLYIDQWGRSTVEAIIPKYAPSSDGNNEQAYIAAVLADVARWRAGRV